MRRKLFGGWISNGKYPRYGRNFGGQVPQQEYMYSGHNACPGCGATLVVRYMMKALQDKAVIVIPASCWSIISGVNPLRCLETVVLHSPFPAAAAVGSGIKKGLQAVGDLQTQVVVLAGDGGTFDIGIQGLSGAAERNDDIIFVCYDNEAYMNTGMQKSSATPYGSASTTTPPPRVKQNPKKDIMKIMAAHRFPMQPLQLLLFLKTCLPGPPGDGNTGFPLPAHFNPCPQGGEALEKTVELSRLAVQTCVFPFSRLKTETLSFDIALRPAFLWKIISLCRNVLLPLIRSKLNLPGKV